MKYFKQISITAIVVYMLSITACRDHRVEVIPGGLNPVSKLDNSNDPGICYSTTGLAGFNGLISL